MVANEVKELAKETARATEEIGQRVSQIQHDTDDAVEAVARITTIINDIRESQLSIASAVEEQEATTSEITRNVNDAAKGVGDIANSVRSFATAAEDTSRSTAHVLAKGDQLTDIAVAIQTIVDGTSGSARSAATQIGLPASNARSVSPEQRFGAGFGRSEHETAATKTSFDSTTK